MFSDIPVIIDPKLWDAVSSNLENNKKNVGKKEHYHYLLNGLVYCDHCNDMVIGKKRLKGSDNAYKCKGKRPPHKSCPDSRGISLPKLETFVVQHLFNSKELKKLLINAPKDGSHSLNLKNEKRKKESEIENTSKAVGRLTKLLKNPDLEDDENFVSEYLAKKKKLETLEKEVLELETKIKDVEYNVRREKAKSIIESYSEDVGFTELKRLIHSLVEKIVIRHRKEQKGGHFLISIKYKNYEEYSVFTTNWQSNKWLWLSHQSSTAISDEDLELDYELATFISEKHGLETPQKSNFKGFESATLKHDIITLDPTQLLNYD